MTIEKAMKILRAVDGIECRFQGYTTALGIAVQALEKQLPKKIPAVNTPCHVKAFDSDTETVYTYSCVKCPVCSKWIVANVNHEYCQYCGQALDWSDENE